MFLLCRGKKSDAAFAQRNFTATAATE